LSIPKAWRVKARRAFPYRQGELDRRLEGNLHGFGLYRSPAGVAMVGRAATLDEVKQAFRASYERWRAWSARSLP